MGSTKYIVSFWINKQEESEFATVVRKYNNRQSFSHSYQVEVVGQREIPVEDKKFSQAYIEISLACTDVVALLMFGEFRGNKTMQKWAREEKEQTGGGLSNG
jgi:Tfp pilus assembly ATPase PilU